MVITVILQLLYSTNVGCHNNKESTICLAAVDSNNAVLVQLLLVWLLIVAVDVAVDVAVAVAAVVAVSGC